MKLFMLAVATLVAVGLVAGCGSAGPALLQGNDAEEQQADPQEAATAEGTVPSEQRTLKTTEAPSALGLLKDWSTWLVGLQTGALALVSFIAGKDGFVTFTRRAARAMLYLAIVSFAGSVITATFVLGAIPTIRMRLGNENELNDLWGALLGDWWCPSLPADTPDANFYCMRAFDGLPVPLVVFTFLEHWMFILGIVFFGVAIFLELWKRGLKQIANPKRPLTRISDSHACHEPSARSEPAAQPGQQRAWGGRRTVF